MKLFGRMLFSLLGVLLFACSPGDDIAGSKGGSETTNGIIASIVTGDGTPAVGSIVRIRRTDYISIPDSSYGETADRFDICTDSNGIFRVGGVDPGSYYIEINDSAAGDHDGGALLLACTVEDDDSIIDLGSRSLQPFAYLGGRVAGDTGKECFVQVRGLEHVAPVEQDGSFEFDDLPGGRMDVLVMNRSNEHTREVRDIAALPGDTVTVQVPATAAWSRFIYLDTLVAEIDGTVELTGFPLLVRLDARTFDFGQARPGGEDIRAVKPDGTSLPFEIEQWDCENHTAVLWIRIDTVFGGRTGQAVVLQWGDPTAESLSDGKAVFDTVEESAWVWHFNSIPESGNLPQDGENTPETIAGMTGQAFRFDGTDDCFALPVLNVSGDYTLSCWVRFADLSSTQRLIWKDSSYTLWYDHESGGLRVEHFCNSREWRGGNQESGQPVPVSTDIWYYCAGTYDGDKIRLYINGTAVDSVESVDDDHQSSLEPLFLGSNGRGEFFNGSMDEVRIEDVKHSAEWIRLSYRNQRQ